MDTELPLTGLVELIASHDERYDDPKFHRAVFNYVKDRVRPVVLPSSCPPLPVIVYAIRNILEPSFLVQEIPNLLRLIVHLELIRQDITGTMQRMLRDSDDPASPFSLDAEHRAALAQLTGAKRLAAQRTVYRKIVNGCCLRHMHHLWRIYNPDRDPPLTAALIDYFPTLLERDPELLDDCRASLATHPWHYGLSADERAANRETGQRAAEFMIGTAHYDEDPAAYCSDHGFDPDTPLDEIFPPPDERQIVEAVMRYIKMVRNAADKLEAVLSELDGPLG